MKSKYNRNRRRQRQKERDAERKRDRHRSKDLVRQGREDELGGIPSYRLKDAVPAFKHRDQRPNKVIGR